MFYDVERSKRWPKYAQKLDMEQQRSLKPFNFSSSFIHSSPFPLAWCLQTGTLIPLLHNCSEMLPFHRKDASHSHTLCKQDINCYTSEDMLHYAWKGLLSCTHRGPSLRQRANPSLWLAFLPFLGGRQNSASSSLVGKSCAVENNPPSSTFKAGLTPADHAAGPVPAGQFLKSASPSCAHRVIERVGELKLL